MIMKFLALVCILLTAVSIRSIEAQWYKNDEFQFYEGMEIGCGGRRMQLNHQMKQVECIPRHTLVKLTPAPGYTFYPNYVPVKRCTGFCPKKSCMPVKTEIKKIVVRMDGYNSSTCYHVSVEEHVKCKCRCSVKENHCNVHQVYSENNCACECRNKEECNAARRMIWNEKRCRCTCNRPEEACSSGLEWVPALCGCAKVMEMPYSSYTKK